MVEIKYVIFGAILMFFIVRIYKSSSTRFYGDYSFDIETPFWVILLIIFLLIWGGIFWW
jgi:hypothetical protein